MLPVEDILQRRGNGGVAEARGSVREQRRLPLPIQPIDARRTGRFVELNDVRQRDVTEALRRNGQEAEPLFVRAILRVGANVDFVLLTVLFVGRDLLSLYEQLQGVRYVARLHAQVRRARSVDVHADLGLADDERRVDVDRAGHLSELVGRVRRDGFELLQVRSANRVLRACRRKAAAAEQRDLSDVDPKLLRLLGDDLVPDPVHHFVLRQRPLVRIGQQHEHRREIVGSCAVVADGGHREPRFRAEPNLASDAFRRQARLAEARPLGRAHLHLEPRLVVDGQESLVRGAGERHAGGERRDGRGHDDPPMLHHETQSAPVEAFDGEVETIHDPLAERLRTLDVLLEPPRRHHGRQRETHEHRHRDREGHGHAE